MTEPVQSQLILQRLLKVTQEVKYVKRETVPKAGTGVLRDVVVSEVRPILLKHGVIVVTSQVGVGRVIETGAKSSNGTPLSIYMGSYQTQFICVEDGSILSVTNEAIGHDYGDKAAGKARTYAEKMNLIGGLFLETGINDEGRLPDATTDAEEEPVTRMPADALELLKGIITRAKDRDELKQARATVKQALFKAQIPEGVHPDRVALNETISHRAGELA